MAGKHQTKFRAGQTVWIPLWLDIAGENERGCVMPITVNNRVDFIHQYSEPRGFLTVRELDRMVKRRLTLSSSCSIYPSKRLAERYFKLRGVKVVNF